MLEKSFHCGIVDRGVEGEVCSDELSGEKEVGIDGMEQDVCMQANVF